MAINGPTADFVTSTLNGAIIASATSATIGTGLNLPEEHGVLHLDYDSATAVGSDNGPETIQYATYNSSTGALSGLTRGLAGTTGVAHGNGATVSCGPSALHFSIDPSWIAANETWTYASATTFTISGDKTGKYAVGDKIKLTQTSVKYFYIVAVSYSSPNTTVTVTGGTDYTLVSAAITSPYYSKMATPVGFPQWFNFDTTGIFYGPSGSAGSYAQTIYFYKFRITGNCCEIRPSVYITNKGSWSGDIYMKVPVPSTEVNDQGIGGVYLVPNNTTFGNGGSVGGTGSGNSYLKFGWNIGTSNMAWSNIATTAFSGGSAYYTIT